MQKCLYMQKSKVHRTNMHFQSDWCFHYGFLQQNIYPVHRITYELEYINRQVLLQSTLVCRKCILSCKSLVLMISSFIQNPCTLYRSSEL